VLAERIACVIKPLWLGLETKKTRNDPLSSLHPRSESGIITRFILLPVIQFFQTCQPIGIASLQSNLGRRRSRMGIQIYDSSPYLPNPFLGFLAKFMHFDAEFLISDKADPI